MNLSNLPPVGTPEYWRAIRQLATRAQVDIDRLWGRVPPSLTDTGSSGSPFDFGLPEPDCMRDVVYTRSWRIEIPSEISITSSNPSVYCTVAAGVYYVASNWSLNASGSTFCPPGSGNGASRLNRDTDTLAENGYLGEHPSGFFSSVGSVGRYSINIGHNYRVQTVGGGLPPIITGYQITSFRVYMDYLESPSIIRWIEYAACYPCTRDEPLTLNVFSDPQAGVVGPASVILTPSRRLVTEW